MELATTPTAHGPYDVRMSYSWRMKACCAAALPSAHVVGAVSLWLRYVPAVSDHVRVKQRSLASSLINRTVVGGFFCCYCTFKFSASAANPVHASRGEAERGVVFREESFFSWHVGPTTPEGWCCTRGFLFSNSR
jgi:hypothetical protein